MSLLYQLDGHWDGGFFTNQFTWEIERDILKESGLESKGFQPVFPAIATSWADTELSQDLHRSSRNQSPGSSEFSRQ